AMAAGLPIACSNRGPMPEILGDAGVYFDPERPEELVTAIEALLKDADVRQRCARDAYDRARQYSWERCAKETFSFLSEALHTHQQNGRCSTPRTFARMNSFC